jgi:hypothetical protein
LDWIAIFQFVIAGSILAAVMGLFRIDNMLKIMNGRIGRLETWTHEHEKLDDAKHEDQQRQIDDLKGKL